MVHPYPSPYIAISKIEHHGEGSRRREGGRGEDHIQNLCTITLDGIVNGHEVVSGGCTAVLHDDGWSHCDGHVPCCELLECACVDEVGESVGGPVVAS